MAILIEHFAGAFPLWLAPEQIRVMPISDKFNEYGQSVVKAIRDAGFRATMDDSGQRVQAKIKIAQDLKTPYMLIVGGKDQEAQTVSVRDRTRGDLGAVPLADFLTKAKLEADSHGKETITA